MLSYFMLADHLSIRTLQSEGEGKEIVGWRFETDGVGSFGELRPNSHAWSGSETTLRVRREQQRPDLEARIRSYLYGILLRVPCKLEWDLGNEEKQATNQGELVLTNK